MPPTQSHQRRTPPPVIVVAFAEELEFEETDVVAPAEPPLLSPAELATLPLLYPQAEPMPFLVTVSKRVVPQMSKVF